MVKSCYFGRCYYSSADNWHPCKQEAVYECETAANTLMFIIKNTFF